MKFPAQKRYFIFAIIYFVFMWLLTTTYLLLSLSNIICAEINGFAYDDDGNLYLGYNSQIVVLDQTGSKIRAFSSKTDSSFRFYIYQEAIYNYISPSMLLITDLYGRELEQIEVTNDNRDSLPYAQDSSNERTTTDGTKYFCDYHNGRYTIYKQNGENMVEMYKMPLFDYSLKLLFNLSFISIWIMIPLTIYKLSKDPNMVIIDIFGRVYKRHGKIDNS